VAGATNVQGSRARADLGVLFVHGIGEQLQGQTLVRFADPLSRWFTRWFSRDVRIEADIGTGPPIGAVFVNGSELVPGDGAPANTVMLVHPAAAEGMGGESKWILAESWWAETFRPPQTSALLLWLLLILPYMLLEQFYVPFMRSMRMNRGFKSRGVEGLIFSWARSIGFFALFLAALPLALLGAIPVIVLLIPMLVPIPRVQAVAKAGALKLASTLGDCFVLISSTVQFDAMVNQVAADLEWLKRRAPKVAVVAHSQGAAVAYEALTRYGCPRNMHMFITVGQGLGKLMRMRKLQALHRTTRFVVAWAGLVGLVLLAVSIPQVAFTIWKNPTHQTALYVVLGIGAALTASVYVAYHFFLKKALADQPDFLQNRGGDLVPWIDYYASADPVSNGPLFTSLRDEEAKVIREIEVWNHASVLSDHTSYAKSEDDFMSCLAQHLCSLVDGWDLPDADRELLEHARWRGWWRVWWLTFARVICFAAGIATIVRLWHHLTPIGTRVIAATPSSLGRLVAVVMKPVKALIIVGSPSNQLLAGAATVVVLLVGGYLILTVIWRYWEARDVQRFFHRNPTAERDDPLGGPEFWCFLVTIAIGIEIAVQVGITQGYGSSWHLVHHWLATLAVLTGLGAGSFVLNKVARTRLRRLEAWLRNRYPRELAHARSAQTETPEGSLSPA
jgi:hypothetical protein